MTNKNKITLEERLLKITAAAYILNETFDSRMKLLKYDYKIAWCTENKKMRYLRYARLKDEANGFVIHIYQVALSGISLYQKGKRTLKELDKLDEVLFKDTVNSLNQDFNSLENSVKNLKETRDRAAHQKYYQLSTTLFENEIKIKKILSKVSKKLDDLMSEIIKDDAKLQGMFIKEINSQKGWLVNRSSEISNQKNRFIKDIEEITQ